MERTRAGGTGAAILCAVSIGAREWATRGLRTSAAEAVTVAEWGSRLSLAADLSALFLTVAVAAGLVALSVAWRASRGGPAPGSHPALAALLITSVGFAAYAGHRVAGAPSRHPGLAVPHPGRRPATSDDGRLPRPLARGLGGSRGRRLRPLPQEGIITSPTDRPATLSDPPPPASRGA